MSDADPALLLIEDNPLDARLIREFLRVPLPGCGPMVWVTNLEQGLQKLAQREFALVLMDLFLPDNEGLIGLSRLRSRVFSAPVIVLTGLHDEALAVDALKAGAQDYLVKGHFDESLLRRAIQHALERHRLMETLQTYEERYALAVQATNVGIWDWNPQTNAIYFSPGWKRLLGFGDEEVPNNLAWLAQALHPDDRPNFHQDIEPSTLLKNTEYDVEARLRHKSGDYRWMHVKGLIAKDSDGTPYRVVGTMLDVTDRKQMEHALVAERERLTVTLRSIADGVIATDTHNRVRLINPVAEGLTGWSQAEAQDRLLEEVFPVLDEALTGVWSATDQQRADAIDQVRTLVHRDGSERLIEVSHSTMRDEQQRQVGAVYIIRDVTERKKAEEARAHLAAIIESADGAIYSKTLDGIITSWNAGAERMLGYPADEVLGLTGDFLWDAPHANEALHLTQRVIGGDSAEYSESTMIHRDGRRIEVALTKSLIRNRAGEVIGVSTIAYDITERKRTELELKKYREGLEVLIEERTRELTAANRELESFCYSVSHDLRAPLRSIDGFSQALMEDYRGKLDENGQMYIERVHHATRKMAQLIEDLLNLSRVTRSEFRTQPVDLSAIANSVIEELRQAYPQRQVEVQIESNIRVQGDPTLLRVLLTNLLGNAWKFTAKKPAARILFGWAPLRDGKPTLQVQDNGAGFDMTYAKKLFSPFQRLHAVTEFEGTGIGLAIAQRVMHRHGGEIWAEGKIDEGATIFFQFRGEGTTRSTADA